MDVRAFELPPLEAPPGMVVGLPAAAQAATAAPQIDIAAEAEAARLAAREEGLLQGRMEAEAQMASAIAALQQAAVDLAAERERVAAAAEAAAVELGLKIAEQALAGAIDVAPERVVDVVRGALRRLVDRERVTILVHPDDLDLVRAASERLVGELGGIEHCDVQAERRVARGGAIVRTVEGEVDATLATKLSRAREVLEEELRAPAA
jgi:flagellar assembly protein FliH